MTNQYPPGYPPQGMPNQYPPQASPYQAYGQGQPQQPQQQYPTYPGGQMGFPPPPPQQQPQMQYPQGFQPTQAPGPSMMPPPPPAGGGFYMPTEEAIQSSYQAAADLRQRMMQARSGQFSKMRFFQIAGPNGQPWNKAFVGFVGSKAIYIMPAWKEGVMNYIKRVTHFWKSQSFPQGTSINSAGDGSLITKAHRLALDQGTKNAWAAPKTKYVYQGFPYEWDFNTNSLSLDPSQCIHEDGTLHPLLLDVGADCHGQIQDISQTRKFVSTFHPDYGRPLGIKKTKTGQQAMDVDYKVIDLDQQPLADVFRPGLAYLYALDELFKPATVEEQIKAILDAGLPMPPEAGGFRGQAQTGYEQQPQIPASMPQMQGQYPQYPPQQQQGSYQQAPNPPAPNPYQGQMQGQGQPQYPPQGQQGQYPQYPPQQQQTPPQNPWGGPQFGGAAANQSQGGAWPPPPQGQQQAPQFMQPPPPKPLPPPPPGMGPASSTPMLPPQNFQGQPPPPPQHPQQQGSPAASGPLTPEDLQKQLEGQEVPF